MVKKISIIVVFLIVLINLSFVIAIDVNSCQTLSSNDTFYTLTGNIESAGTCIQITNNNITLDCKGYSIRYSSTGSGVNGIISNANFTNIMNCKFLSGDLNSKIGKGIYYENVDNGSIINNTFMIDDINNFGVDFLNSQGNNISNNFINVSGAGSIAVRLNSISKDNNLNSNEINLMADNVKGIYINNSDSNLILRNIVNSWFEVNYLIYMSSSNNSLLNNNQFLAYSYNSFGVYSSYSGDNLIINNLINVYNDSSEGLKLIGSNFSRINNNSFNLIGDEVYILDLVVSENVNISNNYINLSGVDSYGIFFESSNNNSVSINNMTTLGTNTLGIYLDSDSNMFFNNYINTQSQESGGIFIDSGNQNLIEGSNIYVNGTYSNGINVYASNSNQFINNEITATGFESNGVSMNLANNNSFKQDSYRIYDSFGKGIYIVSSNSNNFSNVSLNLYGNNTKGIYLDKNNHLINFEQIIFNNITNNSLLLYLNRDTNNILIKDVNLNLSNNLNNIYTSGNSENSTIIFYNVSYLNSNLSIMSNAVFNIYWYLDIYVNYSNGSIIEGANISVIGNDGIVSELSDDSGKIRKILFDKVINSTDVIYDYNYTINVSYNGDSLVGYSDMNNNDNKYFTFNISNDDVIINSLTGSGGGGGGSFKGSCNNAWECSEWSECLIGKSKRSCEKVVSYCNSESPNTEKDCNDNKDSGSNKGKNKKSDNNDRALFDINIRVLEPVISEDMMLSTSISLINFGDLSKVNVSLEYQIKDINGDIVLVENEETSVDTQREFIKEIDVSGLERGEYELIVNLEYDDQTEPAYSVEKFRIYGEEKDYGYLLFVGVFLIVIAAIFLYFHYKGRPKKVMKMYKEIHEAKDYKKHHDKKHLKEVYDELKEEYHQLDENDKEELYPKINRVYGIDKE